MPNKCNTILHKEVTINDLDSILIDLLDGWSGSRYSTWRSSTSSWHTSRPSSRLIQLGDNWVAHTLDLLLLVLELLDLGELVGVEPLDGLVALLGDLFLVVLGDLVGDLLVLDGGLHVKAVAFKTVLCRNSVLLLVVLVLELSASLTILSISSLERRPLSLVMVILFCLPVDLSQADTFRIPLASMSKVTSI